MCMLFCWACQYMAISLSTANLMPNISDKSVAERLQWCQNASAVLTVAGCVFGVELMRVLVWVTPAGTMDEGGVEQPAYLNFDTTLLSAPLGNEMSVRGPCLPIPHPIPQPLAPARLCAQSPCMLQSHSGPCDQFAMPPDPSLC